MQMKDRATPPARRNRRQFLRAACAVAGAAAVSACGGGESDPPPQYVLVHGAWHGGWAWDRVVPLLQAAGAGAHAPTLAGLAERAGEMSTAINLDTHIADILTLVRTRDLRDVVLVAHSYGGFPATGAIEALAGEGRLRCAVYLDAFVPTPGDRLFNYVDAAGQAQMQADFAAGNPRWPKIPAMYFGLESQADIDWVDARLTDHPSGTYLQALRMGQPAAAAAPRRAFISCTSPALDVLAPTKERVKADPGWSFSEIAAGHDVMVSRPRQLADLLLAQGRN
ncbi:alpha/beta hydrolase [Ramlibacter sp. G-1-2-2]|uniref:Alpha/beta hydrolase n=1 Tax=Ramlibacter agri TaxID=2728837 RepID=A0A848HI71_9BURK|nr:alpha/beta hydrolase family protein [Ramlibacter agri]NML47398.1 alpha/beta hydrolase [Ramlibacter agri]